MAPPERNPPTLSELMATIKRPQPVRKPNIISKEYVSESGSEDESEIEGESEKESQIGDKKSPVRRIGSADRSVSSSDSNDEDARSQSSVVTSEADAPEVQPSAKHLPKPQLATPFEPPNGFQAASLTSHPSSPAFKVFTPNALAGKQIWHITAPASVPIRSIKEVTLESVRKGEATLRHGGADYGFVMEDISELSRPKLLAPSRDNEQYRQVQSDITQKLDLRLITRLPDVSNRFPQSVTGSRIRTPSSTTSSKSAREQPEGLRMRFLPTGFGEGEAGQIGSSSSSADNSDEHNPQSQSRVFGGSSSSFSLEKRKKAALDEIRRHQKESSNEPSSFTGPPSKKSKQSHKQPQDPQLPSSSIGDLASSDPRSVGVSRQKKSHKRHKSGDCSPISSSSMAGPAAERKEQPREALDGNSRHRKKDKQNHKSIK
ncbi:MAG: hypothetical protein M1812_004760 [Candelaria pacifica]|nr:MAG: hypothetical protein M1812_004760 [Candelaria pacifica]